MLDNRNELLCNLISAEFQKLKEKQYLDTFEIHEWFEGHINIANTAITGFPGMVLGRNGSHETDVFESDNRVFFKMTVAWHYESPDNGIPPDLQHVKKLVSDVTINHVKSTDIGFSLNGELIFDLDKWQNIVLPYMRERINFAMVQNNVSAADVDKSMHELDLLLKRFYPTVTCETLRMAATLGMVDSEDNSVFISWFKGYLEGNTDNKVIIPADLYEVS